MMLPFGIKSAPGYFQEIMEQLIRNLGGVAVYMDNILVGGNNVQEHLESLRALFERLNEKGVRCNLEKCIFAQPNVEYLGHTLSKDGVGKRFKIDTVLKMAPPKYVGTLRSFLGSVQFYAKFLSPSLSTITEPLHKLTRKSQHWSWGREEQEAFEKLKEWLCKDNVLVHSGPSLKLGISCDASEVGIGGVLFTAIPVTVSDQLPISQRRSRRRNQSTVKFIKRLLL